MAKCKKCHHDCHCNGDLHADEYGTCACDNCACKRTYEKKQDHANDMSYEHVQVMTDRDDWYLEKMHSYGALFLGPRTNVANGDKVIGTNHTLPTKKAGRYTGGLFVGKFIKTLTFQRMSKEATKVVGATAARLGRAEGMEAHARTADIRLRKYGFSN